MIGRDLLFVLLLTAAVSVGLTSCENPPAESADTRWDLELISTFGDPGISEDAVPAVIGSAISATWSSAGLFVLDQQASQIIWFDLSGEAIATAGRSGDGPGEFRLARHVTLQNDSVVSALDYETGRVTTFRVPSLEVERVISGISGRGFHHVWVGDTIWVVRPNRDGPTSPLATAHLASSGAQIDAAPVADPEDQPFGGAFDLAATATRLVTSTTRPGVWWERRAGEWRRVGEPLFPDAPPEKRVEVGPQSFQVIPSPVSASSIAVINDSLVVQAFIRQEGVQEAENPSEVPREAFLGVFSVDGTHLQTLPIDTGPGCLNSAGEFQLLVCTWEPYPQVRLYRLGRTPG